MIINSVKIESFRSIVSQTINLDSHCIGLVGLNEAGKSNVLSAIRTLDNDYKLLSTDTCKITGKKPKITYYFTLTDSDNETIKTCINSYLEKTSKLNYDDIFNAEPHKLISNIYRYKCLNDKNEVLSVIYFKVVGVKNGILFAKNIIGKETTVIKVDDIDVPVSKSIFVKTESLNSGLEGLFEPLAVTNIFSALFKPISEAITKLIPTVTYWQYDATHLLNSEIKYDELIAVDDIREYSIPLNNLLYISNGLNVECDDDVKELIKLWKIDSSKRRKDSDIINKSINKYIKDVWQDYNQEISIALEETKMTVHVKDPDTPESNYYTMIERSQGFKTFVSFIMTMAADADSSPNYVLVLDEPETHLHPSGVRFMLEELKKLGMKGNYVVFATHSVFMIDRSNLKNYSIVKKKDEVTYIDPVKRNNITQESVIYESLGTAIDEFSIPNKNIMFEGELDRLLFEFYISKCMTKKNKATEYELLDGGGTNTMLKYFKDKTVPKDSKWVFVLDNDKPGRAFIDELKKTTGIDVDKQCLYMHYSSEHDYELEDILPNDIVNNIIKNVINEMSIDGLTPPHAFTNDALSHQLNEMKNRSKLTHDQSAKFEAEFKSLLHSEITTLLSKIESFEKTQTLRKQKFCESFSQYSSFCDELLKVI